MGLVIDSRGHLITDEVVSPHSRQQPSMGYTVVDLGRLPQQVEVIMLGAGAGEVEQRVIAFSAELPH